MAGRIWRHGLDPDAAFHLVRRNSRAPIAFGIMPFGLTMVGPVIYTFGTPEQKAVPAPHPVGR